MTRLPGSRREDETLREWVTRCWRLGWVPANGGREEPMMLRGKRVLYCVDLQRGVHAYLNLDTDMVEENA